MNHRILSEANLNAVFSEDMKLNPESWEGIKNKMRSLDNEALRELANLSNGAIKLFAKQILFERGAIRIT